LLKKKKEWYKFSQLLDKNPLSNLLLIKYLNMY